MHPDDLTRELRKIPFQPFRIHLSNGRTYEIRHSEFLVVGRTAALFYSLSPGLIFPKEEDYEVISLRHITNLEKLPLAEASSLSPGPTPQNN